MGADRRPIAVRPHFDYGIRYGDGILRAPGEPINTSVQSFSPGVLFEGPAHWVLDYTFTRTFYSSPLLADTSDRNAHLSGNFSRNDWKAELTQDYGSNTRSSNDTGQQTYERNVGTQVTLAREIGEHTRLDTAVYRNLRIANPVVPLESWIGSDWIQWGSLVSLSYRHSSKTQWTISTRAGYDEIEQQPDMTVLLPQATIDWRPIDNFSFIAEGGIEQRKFKGFDKTLRTFTYTLISSYRPFKTTTITAGVLQSSSVSYFSDQITESSSSNIGIEQRFLGKFYISASVSRRKVSYVLPQTGFIENRNDSIDAFYVKVSTVLLKKVPVGLYFNRSRNASNAFGFSNTVHELGGELSYRF